VATSFPAVQTYLGNVAMGFLESEYDVSIKIDRLKFFWPNELALEGVFLEDDQHDTIAYINDLKVGVFGFDFTQNHLMLTHLDWNGGKFYLRKHPGDSVYAFYDFIRSFSVEDPLGDIQEVSEIPETSYSPPFSLSIDQIEIRDLSFEKNPIGCDSCTAIFLDNAGVAVKDFELYDASVSGDIRDLFFVDRDRFQLYTFQGKASYNDTLILVDDLYFMTTGSQVSGNASLSYGPDDFSDFLNKVKLDVTFYESSFDSKEFISYIPEFPDFDKFTFSGEGEGVINDFRVSQLDFRNFKETRLYGNAHVTQCTEVEEIKVIADVGIFKTTAYELSENLNQFFDQPINEWADPVQFIDLRGKYEWSMDHFSMDGDLSTGIGEGYANVILTELRSPSTAKYEGRVDFQWLELGKIINSEEIGSSRFNGEIKGKGFTKESLELNVSMDVEKLEYNQYPYSNIDISGIIEESFFNGKINVNDPNLEFGFDGNISFNSDTSVLDFKAHLEHADLYALNLYVDSISSVSGDIDIDFRFFEDRWWDGSVNVSNITYETKDRFFFFDQILLFSENTNNTQKIDFTSKIVSGDIQGNFKINDLFLSYPYILDQGLITYTYQGTIPEVDASISLNFNNTEILSTLLKTDFFIEPNTRLSSLISTEKSEYSITLTTDGLRFKNLAVKKTEMNLAQRSESFFLEFESERFSVGSEKIDSVSITADTQNSMARLEAFGIYQDSIDSRVHLFANGNRNQEESIDFNVENTTFNYGDTYFSIQPNSIFTIDSAGAIFFRDLSMQSSRDHLLLNGELSSNSESKLDLVIDSLSFFPLNYAIGSESSRFGGTVSGDLEVTDLMGTRIFTGELEVDTLIFNKRNQGHVKITSLWNPTNRWLDIDLEASLKELKTLDFTGHLSPDSTLAISFDGNLNRQRIGAFNSFFDGILSNMRGVANGSVGIKGSLKRPIISGSLSLNKVGFTIPFLNTDYSFESDPNVTFTSTAIDISSFDLRNTKDGSMGRFTGEITHNNFEDLHLDFDIDADNLLALDTDVEDNPYFYGNIKATGKVTLKGPLDDITLSMKATTEEGTDFKIPLSGPTEVSQMDYISFVNYDVFLPQDLELAPAPKLNGLTINLDVDVTPSAKVELIMDETVGDKITGRAEGNLRMNISPGGEIYMFGNMGIVKGNYLFTLQNILNKPFEIEPGGTVSWTGDPFDAQVSLDAKYVTKTALNNYLTTESNQKYPVDVYLNLEGALMNPDIKFDIKIPTANTALQEELSNRLSSDDNMNRQAFSLLILNSFFSDNVSSTEYVSNSVTSNTSQALFTQLSNFLAQGLGSYVDIQLGYNPGTGANPETGLTNNEELEVGLSKTFFDDKITVNSVVDVPVGSNPNSIVGDVEVEYQITEKVRAKAFNRSNQDNPALDKLSPYSQGVGVLYRTDFDTFGELMDILFGRDPEEETPSNSEETPSEPSSEEVPEDTVEESPKDIPAEKEPVSEEPENKKGTLPKVE